MTLTLLNRVTKLFSSARNNIVIVSAFIGAATLKQLLSSVSEGIPVVIYTRWRLSDLASGATDPEIFDIAAQHKAKLMAHSSLHAKIYVSDTHTLVGSANATASGLGTSNSPNLELLVEHQVNNPHIIAILDNLRKNAHPVKKINVASLKQIKSVLEQNPYSIDESAPDWLPVSSTKDVLNFLDHQNSNENAICDCIALGLSIGNKKNDIKKIVRNQRVFKLLSNAVRENMVGMTIPDIVTMLSSEFKISPAKTETTCSFLMDWIDFCADDIYLVHPRSGGPMLCPWSKI